MPVSKTDQFIILNGKMLDVTKAGLNPKNRAFLFGDGLFESIKVVNGKPLFVSVHFSRLVEGMKALQIETKSDFTAERLEREIIELSKHCGLTGGGRVRVTLYRNHGGFYLPTGEGFSYVISIISDAVNAFELNKEGLVVNLYTEVKKQITPLSHFKTINCLNYILASIYARSANLDDALLVNEKDHIIESTSSNLFIVSNGVLYTPAVSDGCVGGTMRMQIINLALENNIKVYECSLTPQNLLAADEMFLTNAIQGIKWVSGYRMKRYFHKMSDVLIAKLNAKAQELTA
jgi:branched-subunit amino acid aminotransferase/4-amino-4-deoxychorismate lyase